MFSGLSTAVSLITRLVTNKIMAVYLGTDGLFLLGQLKDFLKLAHVGNHLGSTNGTIALTASRKNNPETLKKLLGTSALTHLACSVLIMLFVIVFNKWLSSYLFKSDAYGTILIAIGISLVTISLYALIMAVLNGFKRIKLYVLINIIATVISAIVLILLILKFEIKGALFAFAITQGLSFIIALIALLIARPFELKLLFSGFDKSSFQQLTKYSVMAIVGPFCLVAATLFVRNYINAEFDKDHAGSWEGMWRLSAIYLLFLTTTFKFYLLPTFAELEGKALRKEVFKIWKYVVPLLIIMGLLIYFLRDFVINFFLAKEFYLIGVLIGFHLIGDLFKMSGWVLGNILISKTHTKAFVAFQLEWALVFIILTLVLVPGYGFVGVAMAYCFAYIIHFTLLNLYFRKLLWVFN